VHERASEREKETARARENAFSHRRKTSLDVLSRAERDRDTWRESEREREHLLASPQNILGIRIQIERESTHARE